MATRKLERNRSTKESREWWDAVEEAAASAPLHPGDCRRCAAAEARAERYREALEAVCEGVLMRSDGTLHSTRWAEIARTALADEEPRDGE